MAERIARAARRVGFDDAATLRASVLFERIIEHRRAAIDDERDPEFLHPGRTAVVLIEDLRTRDYACVAAGMALDSLFPGRSPDADMLIAWGEDEAARLLDEIPAADADDETQTETLVTASAAARSAALAERLDHARHLHLRDPREWDAFHDRVVRVYLPLAARTNATLERRYRWWTGMFVRRYLPSARRTGA